MNFQILLTKRQGTSPTTRSYIEREEQRLRVEEGGTERTLQLAGE